MFFLFPFAGYCYSFHTNTSKHYKIEFKFIRNILSDAKAYQKFQRWKDLLEVLAMRKEHIIIEISFVVNMNAVKKHICLS